MLNKLLWKYYHPYAINLAKLIETPFKVRTALLKKTEDRSLGAWWSLCRLSFSMNKGSAQYRKAETALICTALPLLTTIKASRFFSFNERLIIQTLHGRICVPLPEHGPEGLINFIIYIYTQIPEVEFSEKEVLDKLHEIGDLESMRAAATEFFIESEDRSRSKQYLIELAKARNNYEIRTGVYNNAKFAVLYKMSY